MSEDKVIALNAEQAFSIEKDLMIAIDELVFSDKYSEMSNVSIIGILELTKQRVING